MVTLSNIILKNLTDGKYRTVKCGLTTMEIKIPSVIDPLTYSYNKEEYQDYLDKIGCSKSQRERLVALLFN